VFSNVQCSGGYDGIFYGWFCVNGLVVMDPETRNLTTLSEADGGFSPTWSKLDDVIAFRRDPGSLYVLPLHGASAMQLKISGVNLEYDPAWSPDGRRLSFTCTIAPRNYDLCIADKDGANLVRLTNTGGSNSDPAWSPDGKRIAFTADSAIALISPDGGGVTRLTDGSGPAWSRDGEKLVFAGDDGLYTINVDGSNRTRLTAGRHYAPAWRP
jgi:TolB protein